MFEIVVTYVTDNGMPEKVRMKVRGRWQVRVGTYATDIVMSEVVGTL